MSICLILDFEGGPAFDSQPGLDLCTFRLWFLNFLALNITRRDGVRYTVRTTDVGAQARPPHAGGQCCAGGGCGGGGPLHGMRQVSDSWKAASDRYRAEYLRRSNAPTSASCTCDNTGPAAARAPAPRPPRAPRGPAAAFLGSLH
ncbi:hypothetical protein EVAR_68384_1 [Eumeta japonica]|uniref:Uncharacterized protein n=1 Tax=Eumeta variegata TaxID=151549 RepID=A0A4C1ZTF3_EUMVA|nr:hypothetical protein EVAR_68384_1 [Eumeta japonica]